MAAIQSANAGLAPEVIVPIALRSGQQVTTPGGTVVLSTTTVPVGKKWRVLRLEGQCRMVGYFTVWFDAIMVARSNSGPATENPNFTFDPYDVATSGKVVEVRYAQSFGPSADVSMVLFATETNA